MHCAINCNLTNISLRANFFSQINVCLYFFSLAKGERIIYLQFLPQFFASANCRHYFKFLTNQVQSLLFFVNKLSPSSYFSSPQNDIINYFFPILGFQTRKKFQAVFKHRIEEDPDSGADLPDLNCADVAAATVKIQKVYRGFATRKRMREVNFHSYFSFSFSFLLYF